MLTKILLPVFALVLLTFIVWLRMYYIRFTEVKKTGLSIKELRPDNIRNLPPNIIFSGDNFRNLCEVPILFYTLVIFLLLFEKVDTIFISLSWIFVLLRYVHSFIHTTNNIIKYRFLFYVISTSVVWFMWLRFAWLVF